MLNIFPALCDDVQIKFNLQADILPPDICDIYAVGRQPSLFYRVITYGYQALEDGTHKAKSANSASVFRTYFRTSFFKCHRMSRIYYDRKLTHGRAKPVGLCI